MHDACLLSGHMLVLAASTGRIWVPSGYHLGTIPYNLMTDPASLQVQHPLQKGGKGKPLHLHPAVEHRIDLSAGLCAPLATVAAAQHLQGVRS